MRTATWVIVATLAILTTANFSFAVDEDANGNITQGPILSLEGDEPPPPPKPKVIVKEKVVIQCAPGSVWSPKNRRCISEDGEAAPAPAPHQQASGSQQKCGDFHKRVMITPPGYGNHNYVITPIDTRCFQSGTIEIRIKMGKGSCDGSFDLLAANQEIPNQGRFQSLAGTYDVPPGVTRTISYTFYKPQVFKFGAEGSWRSNTSTENIADIDVKISAIAE